VAVLAVLPDRKKDTVRQFLETIPKRLWPTMETVCTDMWEGYVNAVEEFAAAHPEVSIEVVVDRFHVAKNYRECVDKVAQARMSSSSERVACIGVRRDQRCDVDCP
jgi:transposase